MAGVQRNRVTAALRNAQSTSLTTTTTTTVTTGGTFYDVAGLSVAITPSLSTSKVMLIGSIDLGAGADVLVSVRLVRDSTAVGVATSPGSRTAATIGVYLATAAMSSVAMHFSMPLHFVDSPASTSAITYKVQVSANSNATTLYVNRSSSDADSVNTFRAISTLSAIEVLA
jgi:hypothetical protein